MADLTTRVKQVMALVFNLEPAEIDDDASIMAIPGWDSVGHANLMLALGEAFDVELSTEAVIELQSIPEIVAYLEAIQPAA